MRAGGPFIPYTPNPLSLSLPSSLSRPTNLASHGVCGDEENGERDGEGEGRARERDDGVATVAARARLAGAQGREGV